MSRARRILKRLGISLGILVIGLPLGLEVAARVTFKPKTAEMTFNAPMNAPVGLYVNDHELAHRPAEGFRGRSKSLGYSVKIRVNQHSLRGPEVGPKERERWLAAGDSFTFAAQVPEDKTFSALLSNDEREVLNGGADSYGTWQAVLQYQRLQPELDFDGVLLTFFVGNDLVDNRRFRQAQAMARRRAEDGASLAEDMRRQGLMSVLAKNSVAWAVIQVSRRTKTMQQQGDPERHRWQMENQIFTRGGAGRLQQLMNETRPALKELQRVVEANGGELVVAVAPPNFAVSEEHRTEVFNLLDLDPDQAAPRAPTDAVLKELEAQGIRSCDLHAPLEQAINDGEQVYFVFDGHWTKRGHEVVAQAIEDCGL